MKVGIVSIGNSKGIRIPKTILTQCNFGDEANLEIVDDKLVIEPVRKKSRKGWAEAFVLMKERKEDGLLIADSLDLEMKDWKW